MTVKIRDTQFKLKDLPEFQEKSEVLCFPQEANVAEVVQSMVNGRQSAVMVTSDGKDNIVGIVTEYDLVAKIINPGKDAKSTTLKDIMTAKMVTANENKSVSNCMHKMAEGQFRHMPVLDDNGRLTGMLSQSDFAAYTWDDIWKRMKEEANLVVRNRYQPLLIAAAVIAYTLLILFFFGAR